MTDTPYWLRENSRRMREGLPLLPAPEGPVDADGNPIDEDGDPVARPSEEI